MQSSKTHKRHYSVVAIEYERSCQSKPPSAVYMTLTNFIIRLSLIAFKIINPRAKHAHIIYFGITHSFDTLLQGYKPESLTSKLT